MKKLILLILTAAVINTVNAQSNDGTKPAMKENPVIIGQQRSFTISKSKLLADPILRMPDAQQDYAVSSFQIALKPAGKGNDVLGPFEIKGNSMATGKGAEILNKLQPGDRLFIEEIVATSIDGRKPELKMNAAVKIE